MTECTKGTEAMREQLPLLAQGALASADTARLRAHLAECPACAAELEVIGAALKVFATATPTVDVAAILRAIPQPTAAPAPPVLRLMPRSRPMWLPRQFLAAAASLLLVGAISVPLVRGYFFPDDLSSPAGSVADGGVSGAPVVPVDLLGASGLSGLGTDELTALLAELESMEATVVAEPITMRRPVVSAPEDL